MPPLSKTLPTNDIGFLRIVASLWGLELASSDPLSAAEELAESLCDAELLEEVVSTLPQEARSALDALAQADGRLPWVVFVRRYGDLRAIGPGKRDREQPHLRPGSTAEVLYYRALLARAFFNTEKGPQEFAFIPDDLLMAMDFAGLISEPQPVEAAAAAAENLPEEPVNVDLDEPVAETGEEDAQEPLQPEPAPPAPHPARAADLPAANALQAPKAAEPLGRPASPGEKSVPLPANDRILDEACTFLAALRLGIQPPVLDIPLPALGDFLQAAGLLSAGNLKPGALKTFLEAPRERALESLQSAWQSSELFNELRQLPGLVFEGSFDNQPLVTREFLLDLLEPLPEGQWWSLASFARDIKTRYPDFQRPAGDYDSWFIKRASDGAYLRGFASWEEVDGALIRYLLCGPLHWLGLLDLACPAEGAPPTAFRSRLEPFPASAPGKLTVTSQGRISVPRQASLAARYQIARFCEWLPARGDDYLYRVTAGSLKKAREQGLKAEQLLAILRKHASSPLPPVFANALQRWEKNGTEASVESLVVLKVARPEVLKELQGSRAARFLGLSLGPTTVVIQPGAQAKVLEALAELGILAEGHLEEE